MNNNIQNFIIKTSSLTGSDYGDFMRSENVYLNQLIKHLIILEDKNINSKLAEMQTYLQFMPNWDISSTRDKLLSDAHYLEELLQGHLQDWESVYVN